MRWYVDAAIGALTAVGLIVVAHAALPNRSASAAPVVRPMTWTGPARAEAVRVSLGEDTAAAEEHVFWEPTPGYGIISPFGYRKLPWEPRGRLHQGVDIAAPAGTFVQLIADGVVVGSGHAPGYGRFVEVEHREGLRSFYAHLSAIAPYAYPGAPLRAGTPIGAVGSTGSSTGAHLHLEVSQAGRPLNPAYFVGRRYEVARGLPLKEASRIPPGVRIAYVSHIPTSKRELMAAREEAKMQARPVLPATVQTEAALRGGADRLGPGQTGLNSSARNAQSPSRAGLVDSRQTAQQPVAGMGEIGS